MSRMKWTDLTVLLWVLAAGAGIIVAKQAQSQEIANRTRCANNLRMIGQALKAYANDNRGSYPRTMTSRDENPKPVWGTPYEGNSALGPSDVNDQFAKANKPEAKYRPAPNDVSAAIFILLRTQEITSDSFVCPSSHAVRWSFPGLQTPLSWTNWKGLQGLREHLSYSMSNPYYSKMAIEAGAKWDNNQPAEFVVAGDMNPGTDDLLKLTLGSPENLMRRGNSANHDQDGQNLLFADGHVEFTSNPFSGVKHDNVYTFGKSDEKAGGVGIIGSPIDANDSVLLPTAKAIGAINAEGKLIPVATNEPAPNETTQTPDGPPTTQPAGTVVLLPGRPFGAATSQDGKWVFLSLLNKSEIAVVQNENGEYKLRRVIPVPGSPTGMTLTHDGEVLVVAAGESVDLLVTSRLTSGDGEPLLATFSDGNDADSIYANVTSDDSVLFVSDEGAQAITVIDLKRVRESGYDAHAVIGKIPVGLEPIALTLSPDEKWLYTTSEIAAPEWKWTPTVKPANPNAPPGALIPEGAVVVVDVAKAKTDPAHSVVARVPAGGSPVRMTISPDGKQVYVTARATNQVLAFDAARLISDPTNARLASVDVGKAPVPLALIQHGKTLVVGNSNRYSTDAQKPGTLSLVDVGKIGKGEAVIGTVTAGGFPREMCVSSDGRKLFVANFASQSLEIIDAEHPPIEGK